MASGPDVTVPGAITMPFPTLRNLTLEWTLTGDSNENGAVQVRWRKKGTQPWLKAMPLRRVPAGAMLGFSWVNRYSGSVFDLEPGTTYEVELFLKDPDGGCAVRVVEATTRPVPAPMAGGTVKPVTPGTLAQVASGAQPGDILELAAGSYAAFSFQRDGQPGKPITLRGVGAAIVNGDLSLISRKHLYVTGLTVNGRIRLNSTAFVAVVRNTVQTAGDGIVAGLRSENDYIADNVVTGSTTWAVGSLGVNGNNIGEGILVTGPGHVIEHNRVRGFRDCVSFYEESEADDQYSLDVIENDLDSCADDAVEADFCFHNCRIVRNRVSNSFIALSSQPGLGGPTYFVRNVVYNAILSAFKLQRGSIGDVALHNTVVKNGDALGVYTSDVFGRQLFRNNLFIGGPGGSYNGYSSGSGRVIDMSSAAPTGDYDWDGFGSTTGAFTGRLGSISFQSAAELRSKTSEKHAFELNMSLFAVTVPYPSSPFPALAVPDLRPKAGSAAHDVGLAIPGINDGFEGNGPELGAYEVGAELPKYGPR